MAMIKSALELALERTRDIKVDERSVMLSEAKAEGKRAAGKYLEDPESADLAAMIAAKDADSREAFRRALFEVLAAQIQLSANDAQVEKLVVVGDGLQAVAKTADRPAQVGAQAAKQVAEMLKQIASFMKRYQDDMKQVDQAIRTQWAPKLREKERQAQARMGREVRLDPMSDPEFAAFYKQNVDQAREGYIQALEGAKKDLAALCGFAEEQA